MILAKEMMSSPIRHLFSSAPLAEALDLFEKRQFRTLPILSPDGRIMGVLSEMSLLKSLILSHARGGKDLKSIQIYEFAAHFEAPVLVKDRDPIENVVRAMAQSRSQRVLVVDSAGKLQGVISPKDIITAIIGRDKSAPSIQQQMDVLKDELKVLREEYDRLTHHQKSLNEFQELMQSSLFLCHSVAEDGTIRFANERLHEVLGYAPRNLIGQNFQILYPDHLHSAVQRGLEELKESGNQKIVYSALKTKNGEAIKVEMTTVPLKDDKGQFTGTATISRIIDAGIMMKLLSGAFSS